ncbi:hypothetical protein GIB67_043064 [Kingdonia uniflora]|uniref:Uncharacterized protein n=1 Tax=Kingdonia uniflora TaxID=39325 RepID=A0A7J7M9V0_9MAGN|nr:hypothetical protein GIB67_043064 [Kingdonia uniflora]
MGTMAVSYEIQEKMRKVSSLNSVEFLQSPKLKIMEGFEFVKGYLSNLIESRLIASRKSFMGEEENLNVYDNYERSGLFECPLCGVDIMGLSGVQRYSHTIDCLDRDDFQKDLFSIGVDALGPRKKIVYALNELGKSNMNEDTRIRDVPQVSCAGTKNLAANKLLTKYFPGSSIVNRNKGFVPSRVQPGTEMNKLGSGCRKGPIRNYVKNGKVRDVPMWCYIPGTSFQIV